MRIEHYDGLNRTPALPLAVEGWFRLFQQGLAGDTVQVQWDHNSLVAFDNDDVAMGIITYAHLEYLKSLTVCIGYVRPAYRRLGVYRALWDALVGKATEMKASVIDSSTFIENAPMRAVASDQRRRETSVNLRFDVT